MEEKEQALKSDDKKGFLYLLGNNITYLLRLCQVSTHDYLLPIRKELTGAPKRQHLTMLQR